MEYGYLGIIPVTFALLSYRMLGEDEKIVYLPLGIQLLASALAGIVVSLAPLAILIGLFAALVAAAFCRLLSVSFVTSEIMGITGLFSIVPIRTFAIDDWVVMLGVYGTVLLILVSMDFGGVVFAKEKGWFSEGWRKNKPEDIGIIALGILGESCLLFADGNYLISALMAAGVVAILLNLKYLNRLKTVSKREQEVSRWMVDSKDYMNVIRSQRHDYNLHIHTLVGLIENEDYEAARNYMRNMASEAADVNDIMPLDDAVLGSLLYNMREAARKKGTEIEYHITYDMKDTLCSGFDCNKIIGNLLQNAIDAAVSETAKKYGIHVRIFKRRGNTVIYVENYFDGKRDQILKAFEAGYTTKHNHEGIGLAMVFRAVNRAQGRIYPEFDTNLVRFVVNLPNRISFEEE